MRRSRYLLRTQKETPKEAAVISHVLMLRTCMIKQLASGIYSYLPLALRSIRKIERIIREELDASGCQELSMPVVQPAEMWMESGRWQKYGKELLRLKDRKENDYCLGPTHEEVITDIVRHEVRSYKELPLNLYQIQTKFRDEIRPRFGLMRGREFIMKDAYSFDCDVETSMDAYWLMYEAYKRIFIRCGLRFKPVEADSGVIGGSFTHEFHVLASSGEDEILSCDACEYAANVERCELPAEDPFKPEGAVAQPEKVATPGKKTIAEVAEFLGKTAADCIKFVLYKADEGLVGVALRGDREVNETAIRNETGAVELEIASQPGLFEAHGLVPGYIGPLGWPESVPLLVDPEVWAMPAAVTGANEADAHLTGVVPSVHMAFAKALPLRLPRPGDVCVRCGEGRLESYRGIEVGQVFRLGTKYSQSMNASYLDAEGKERPIEMGCYGIGVGRTMAAAIEQNHDENGIVWPVQIAPFHVMLLNLDVKDADTTEAADSLYASLTSHGVEVLLDDLPQRPGFKFKDADLIGLPVQLTVGARSLKQGAVELKLRRGGDKRSVPLGQAVEETLLALQNQGWSPKSG